jgi:hypothetical protein
MTTAELEKQILGILNENIISYHGEIYEKVYIKTEADLPKNEGYYFISTGEKYDRNFDVYHFTKVNARQNHLDWLEHVVWYLRPVEQKPDCYPKEFVEWMGAECPYEYHESHKIWMHEMDKRMTTDEIFNYWKNNIKDKQ